LLIHIVQGKGGKGRALATIAPGGAARFVAATTLRCDEQDLRLPPTRCGRWNVVEAVNYFPVQK